MLDMTKTDIIWGGNEFKFNIKKYTGCIHGDTLNIYGTYLCFE